MNDNRFTDRVVGQNIAGVDWIYYPELGYNIISSDGCITVSPRWDDSYLYKYGGRVGQPTPHDVNYTEGMYDKDWNFVFSKYTQNQYNLNLHLE